MTSVLGFRGHVPFHLSGGTAGLALLAVLLAASPAAAQGAAPDSATLEVLRGRFAKRPPVRVQGTFDRVDLGGVRAEPAGLCYDDAFRFGASPASLPASPIPWSEIERIETARTSVGKCAAIGALVGIAGGALWNSALPPQGGAGFLRWGATSGGVALGRTVATVAAGAVLGAVIGSAVRRWDTVYPVPSPAPPGR